MSQMCCSVYSYPVNSTPETRKAGICIQTDLCFFYEFFSLKTNNFINN